MFNPDADHRHSSSREKSAKREKMNAKKPWQDYLPMAHLREEYRFEKATQSKAFPSRSGMHLTRLYAARSDIAHGLRLYQPFFQNSFIVNYFPKKFKLKNSEARFLGSAD
jgi:hypothetical protein